MGPPAGLAGRTSKVVPSSCCHPTSMFQPRRNDRGTVRAQVSTTGAKSGCGGGHQRRPANGPRMTGVGLLVAVARPGDHHPDLLDRLLEGRRGDA
jgi:hypothetical protein